MTPKQKFWQLVYCNFWGCKAPDGPPFWEGRGGQVFVIEGMKDTKCAKCGNEVPE